MYVAVGQAPSPKKRRKTKKERLRRKKESRRDRRRERRPKKHDGKGVKEPNDGEETDIVGAASAAVAATRTRFEAWGLDYFGRNHGAAFSYFEEWMRKHGVTEFTVGPDGNFHADLDLLEAF